MSDVKRIATGDFSIVYTKFSKVIATSDLIDFWSFAKIPMPLFLEIDLAGREPLGHQIVKKLGGKLQPKFAHAMIMDALIDAEKRLDGLVIIVLGVGRSTSSSDLENLYQVLGATANQADVWKRAGKALGFILLESD